jgi:hypothetical protein
MFVTHDQLDLRFAAWLKDIDQRVGTAVAVYAEKSRAEAEILAEGVAARVEARLEARLGPRFDRI